MDVLTVKDLLSLCKAEIKKGNGDKKILITSDDEGNGYHGLFFSFSNVGDTFESEFAPHCYLSNVTDETHILLG